MSLFDYFFGTSDEIDRGDTLDAQLAARNADYAKGGKIYNAASQTVSPEYADSLMGKVTANQASGSTAQLIKTGDQIYDETHASDSGLGQLLKDLLVLSAIGGALWLFFSAGGVTWLKAKSAKIKWLPWAIGGGVLLVAWIVYSRIKKTGQDAGAIASNFGSNIKAVLGF